MTGGKYEGQYLRNQRHGKGKMTWIDGTFYEGEWKFGQRNGYGKFVKDSEVNSGIFRNNKLVES